MSHTCERSSYINIANAVMAGAEVRIDAELGIPGKAGLTPSGVVVFHSQADRERFMAALAKLMLGASRGGSA